MTRTAQPSAGARHEGCKTQAASRLVSGSNKTFRSPLSCLSPSAQRRPRRPASTSSRATLGLTGLTINAMALIAPGAFLWLTFQIQALYGAPMAGSAMWFGIVAALLLCFATAISYAELSKLYPGAGSSYFFAEQAFLWKTKAFRFARLAKFVTGWASHLYYWVYPGVHGGRDRDPRRLPAQPVLPRHLQRHASTARSS